MRFITAHFTLALLAVSILLSLFSLPETQSVSARFVVDIKLKTTNSGIIQIYYDRGNGLNENDSSTANLIPDNIVHNYHLNLPAGKYSYLRLDPIDRQGSLVISGITVSNYHGLILHNLDITNVKAITQIQSLKHSKSGLEIITIPGADDPQLALDFKDPLDLNISYRDIALDILHLSILNFLVLSVITLIIYFISPYLLLKLSWFKSNPCKILLLLALIATLVSVFPVAFEGRSFVSPNYGTFLLYDEFPTLPGSSRIDRADLKGSDIGAIMWQHIPFSKVQYRSIIKDHELPLWSRYNSAGSPLLGQGQSMFGDPLHLFVILARGAAWAWDLKYILAKCLFSLGLGLCVLTLSESLGAAAIIALISPYIGFFIFRVNHPAFFSLCYAPWPLLCLIKLGENRSRASTALLGVALVLTNLALLASGTVKEAYMLLLGVNSLGLLLILFSETERAVKVKNTLLVLGYELLFVLITAPLWYAFVSTLKLSYTQYDHPQAAQIPINSLIGFFDELFYRPLVANESVSNPSLNLLFLFGIIYFLSTLHIQLQKKSRLILFLFSLLPLSLAFGLIAPGFIEQVPVLKNIGHVGNTFSCVLIISASIIAGLGYTTAFIRLKEKEGRADLFISALLLFGLFFLYMSFFHGSSSHSPSDIKPLIQWYLYLGLSSLIALGFLIRYLLKKETLTATPVLLISFISLVLLGRFSQFTHFGFDDYTVQPTHRQSFDARSIAIEKVYGEQYKFPSRAIGFEGNLWSGWSTYLSVEGINAPDALINPRYRELTQASSLSHQWDWRLYLEKAKLTETKPFLDFLNVRYYLDLRSDQGALSKSLKLALATDLDVYESTTVWPRAFFTDQVSTYTTAQDLIAKINKDFKSPFAAVDALDLQGAPGLSALLGHDPSKRVYAPAKSYVLTENSTTFHFINPTAGVAILNEVYWPGYPHATLDGYPAKVFRINHIFQGVLVGPGEHTISISYRPKNFTLCLIVSLSGGLLLIGVTLGLILFKDRNSQT